MAQFVEGLNLSGLRVWTSLMKATIQTAAGINCPKEHWKALNEIDAVSSYRMHRMHSFGGLILNSLLIIDISTTPVN